MLLLTQDFKRKSDSENIHPHVYKDIIDRLTDIKTSPHEYQAVSTNMKLGQVLYFTLDVNQKSVGIILSHPSCLDEVLEETKENDGIYLTEAFKYLNMIAD
jgi:hypothetical protein